MNSLLMPRPALLLFLLCVLVSPIAFSQDPKPPVQKPEPEAFEKEKPAAPKDPKLEAAAKKAIAIAKFNEALDLIEIEIDQRERLEKYGTEQILRYSGEMKQEYRRNQDSLERMEQEEPEEKLQSELETRQKLISLYLWQLQRIGPKFAKQEDAGNRLSIRISRMMSAHREAMRDGAAMNRFHQLMRRSHELTRYRFSSGNDNFYFVVPGEDDAVDQPAALGNPFGNPFGNPAARAAKPVEVPEDRLHPPLQRLLKLSWRDGSLVLDREHWAAPFAGRTLSAIAKDVDSQLIKIGVTMPDENDPNQRNFRRPVSDRPFSILLFENLTRQASKFNGGNFSGGGGGGGTSWHKTFRVGGVDSSLHVNSDQFDFRLHESDGSAPTLRVVSLNPESLRIVITSYDRVLVLSDKLDEPVRLVDVLDDKTISHSAASFAELYAEHADVVEEGLFPALEKLGFSLPPLRGDRDVVDRVLAQLAEISEETLEKFDTLLGQVGSKSFSKRDAATRELESNLAQYLPLVIQAYRQEQLPLEVKTRLKIVLERYENELRELDTLVAKMKLTTDVGYLISIMPMVDPQQQKLVLRQLEKETQQTFGDDIEAWKAWHAKQ